MAEQLVEDVVRYLAATAGCWWTARRVGAVLPHAAEEIEKALEACWQQGILRRKRGIGGIFEYQARTAEAS